MARKIKIVDLFAGPGGLGEGFSDFYTPGGDFPFKISASIEKDPSAHQTLKLRAFYRQFHQDGIPQEYYDFLEGKLGTTPDGSLYQLSKFQKQVLSATREARLLELGKDNREIYQVIEDSLGPNPEPWVLIGGPPCQAYSLVGRSRNLGKAQYRPEDDDRHFLYREYLKVIQRFKPSVFVMENVKGLLSSRVAGKRIFHEILKDLTDPDYALLRKRGEKSACYRVYSISTEMHFDRLIPPETIDPRAFVVRSELYGIPQARHRVILVGVREDIETKPAPLSPSEKLISVAEAIGDLPMIRSRLSGPHDDPIKWADTIRTQLHHLASHSRGKLPAEITKAFSAAAKYISDDLNTGGENLPLISANSKRSRWAEQLRDRRQKSIINHSSRSHMESDLRRYVYCAIIASVTGQSPKGHKQFNLPGLAPDHANWKSGKFSDRFRVQLQDRPSTTITSHISKDGHYFIHPDWRQCRSLTVREAARLQTFPDNYYFVGGRTQQYHQVGNAVPPNLAKAIAKLVYQLLIN